MDNLILSQGSLLASGARNPAIPGTPGASKVGAATRSAGPSKGLITVAGSRSDVRTPGVVTSAIRRGQAAVTQATKPTRYVVPPGPRSGAGKGPSTFMKQVLGGHLPMTWLTSGPQGR